MSGATEGVRATVDHDLCAGVSLCLQQVPKAFVLDENGQSVFVPGPWTVRELDRAVEACPMAAIKITGEESG